MKRTVITGMTLFKLKKIRILKIKLKTMIKLSKIIYCTTYCNFFSLYNIFFSKRKNKTLVFIISALFHLKSETYSYILDFVSISTFLIFIKFKRKWFSKIKETLLFVKILVFKEEEWKTKLFTSSALFLHLKNLKKEFILKKRKKIAVLCDENNFSYRLLLFWFSTHV